MWGGGPGQTSFKTAANKSMANVRQGYPHATRSYGAFGRDFIKESAKSGKPFCLSISFKAPHRPVQPDPAFDHVYRGKKFTKPKTMAVNTVITSRCRAGQGGNTSDSTAGGMRTITTR